MPLTRISELYDVLMNCRADQGGSNEYLFVALEVLLGVFQSIRKSGVGGYGDTIASFMLPSELFALKNCNAINKRSRYIP